MGTDPSLPISRPQSINYTYLPTIVKMEDERVRQERIKLNLMKTRPKPLVVDGKLQPAVSNYDLSSTPDRNKDLCCNVHQYEREMMN